MTKITIPILVRNKLFGGKENNTPTIFWKNSTPQFDQELHNEIDLISFSEVYVSNFRNQALPFYKEWGDLKKLDDYFDNVQKEDSEYSLLMYNFTLPTIKRLCNNPSYQDCMDSYYELQKKYYEEDYEDEDNIRYYNAAKELKQILDNTRPIYNI